MMLGEEVPWIGLGLYVIAVLIAIRPLAGHFAWAWARRARGRSSTRAPDGDEWFRATVVAATFAVVWPVVLIWIAVGSLPKVGAEGVEERERLARRVKELEKELED